MVSLEAWEGLLERLLQDEDTKDVAIEMQDGVLYAHACMLSASSDAMRGMLKHGRAATEKRLYWKEHSVEVGRFFLRLLYTGTVAEDEWTAIDDAPGGKFMCQEMPLRLLLGSLDIARVYQVPHLLHALTEALKDRLDDKNFGEICARAIELDITALRLHCLRYAEGSSSRGFLEGDRVRALRHITVQNADVPEGAIGTVNGTKVIEWDDIGSIGYGTDVELVKDMVQLLSSSESNRVREMYAAKDLPPEVMFELAALWGPCDGQLSSTKRRSFTLRRSL